MTGAKAVVIATAILLNMYQSAYLHVSFMHFVIALLAAKTIAAAIAVLAVTIVAITTTMELLDFVSLNFSLFS